MSKKGFTLVELLMSIVLSSVVLILLLQMLLVLKDLYVNDSIKTEILIRKSNIIKKISSTFEESPITKIRTCGTNPSNCLKFTLASGSEYELSLDRTKNIVKFGSFNVKLTESSEIYEDLDACYFYNNMSLTSGSASHNTGIRIRIPIKDNLLEEEFDATIIYQYNGNDFPNLYSDNASGSIVNYIDSCDATLVN